MRNKKAQFDAMGLLIFILACLVANWLFFRLVDAGKGGAIIRANSGELGDTIDTINVMNMYDISDLIVEGHLDEDWTKVEMTISDTLKKIYSETKNWALEVDGERVVSSGTPIPAKSIIESDVWLPLPYNPDKKNINVKLIVS